jgi:pyruvate, orthophosphate dikinase
MAIHRGAKDPAAKWREKEIPQGVLESDALRINLEETAVEQVAVDPKYAVLQATVAGYRGIRQKADSLLFELNHPFKNWEIILPELRDFSLKYFSSYVRHPKGPQAVEVLIDVFGDAIMNSSKEALEAKAIDYLLSYLQKIITEMDGANQKDIYPVLQECFQSLTSLPEKKFFFLASSHIPLKRLGQIFLRKLPPEVPISEFNGLLTRSLRASYEYWLQEEDPRFWFHRGEEDSPALEEKEGDIFERLSHPRLREHLTQLERLSSRDGTVETLRDLLTLPGYLEIVRAYKEIPGRLSGLWGEGKEGDRDQLGKNRKILALFKIMEMQGLQDIQEEALREINRTLIDLIQKAPPEEMQDFIRKTFSLLKSNVEHYPQTALQCIQTIGAKVFNRAYSPMVELFLEQVLLFGFQYPGVQGVDANWQPISNPSHLMNVRIWLDIITRNPKWCSTLLSALIINLKLGGTCIKDTDLFQKEITKLLNAEIEPVYNLIKQLTKILPVHFNEIGAEGRLRDVTTEIDEISNRKDPLIHFLRKQSHVESSNLIEGFIKEIFHFWRTKDPGGLKKYLPPEIYETLETNGLLIDEVHRILTQVFAAKGLTREEDLLRLPDAELEAIMDREPDLDPTEKKRVSLLIKIYRLVDQKYNLGFQEIRYHLQEASRWGFEGLDSLQRVLDRNDTQECLENLLIYLEGLKEIIVSPKCFEAREDIYRKRHIAVDIPSLYGRYQEKKFDSLGLTLRLENLANIYFERLIDSLDLSFITRATFFELIRAIRYFFRAMQVDGISSIHLDKHLKLLEKSLEIKRFSFTQYLDIFRGFSEGVKDILSVYYVNAHKANLANLIRQMGRNNILPQYLQAVGKEAGPSEFNHQIGERFLRDLVASTFGLQYLDNFLTRIQVTLAEQKETLQEPDLDLLMTYDPKKVSCFLHHPNPLTNDLIHLGSKGYNLVVLASEEVPVPPGFILTTEVFRCWRIIQDYKHANDHFEREIHAGIQQIERTTGRKYGSSSQPLLLAVRSGSAISMPGMMATLLNVGINEEIVEGLARTTGKAWFAWDNYRRFIQSWGMSFGMEREVFNDIMQAYKSRYKVEKKRQFSGEEMKKMAQTYRRAVEERNITLPEDPWAQLHVAIQQVLRSWDSTKAKQYREIMGISDAWGTAVIIQDMVFGNLDLSSGTGVVFTAHPYRKIRRVALWGDFTPGNQGEDIVGGLVSTYPISKEQKEMDEREGDLTLEQNYPEVYKNILEIAKKLVYEKKWNPQEVEFTFETSGKTGLYILQTRDMVSTKREKFEVFSPSAFLQKNFIGKGIGVSGGALSGRVVFKLEEIQRLRKKEPGTPLILVRSDTVPEDIKAISLTDGLLTAKGGQTSHAAIVAFELDKTAIVGCHNLAIMENKGRFMIGNTVVKQGDYISLDGRKGLVYFGKHEIKAEGELYTGLV